MIAQLDELVSSQRTFVTHAAHELRSPLTTLKGELQLALRRPREGAEYRDAILATLVDVDQMAELVESLLSLARAQRQGRPSDTVPAGEVLDEALRMARGPADLRQVTLEVSSTAARGLVIVADRGSLARALRNLIDNAVTHSPEGRTVRLDLEDAGRLARFSVSDEGGGVSEEDAQHLFTPFYRGAQEPAGTGVGLGLAIAMEITRTHGGEVRIDRDHASGARFLLEVPRP
jgi:two-component system heavy metal sensor histidine kinase CusS